MLAKLSVRTCSQYLQKQSSVSFSTVMSSGSLMKKIPLSLCCSSLPSPMLRRECANCDDSPRSFVLMFCVSCNLLTICQRYRDFSVASTISGLDPYRTTGKICRQSPAKSTVSPPNGDEFFRMSCIVLSIDSNTCLCPIEISSMMRRSVFWKRTSVASCGDMLHIEVSWVSKGTLHLLCRVLPWDNRVAEIPKRVVAIAIFFFDLIAARIRLIACVFPVPLLASKANSCPFWASTDFNMASKTFFAPQWVLDIFAGPVVLKFRSCAATHHALFWSVHQLM